MDPTELKASVGHLVREKKIPVSRACRAIGIARATWYHKPKRPENDRPVIAALEEMRQKYPRWGFWKYFCALRLQGHGWNHKRVHRVYREMKLNLISKKKKRLPTREKQTLIVPAKANASWSMDFMCDTLVNRRTFRTLNLLDEGTREGLHIEIGSSMPAERVIRVLEQLEERRGLPEQIRVDNGPEFIAKKLEAWCQTRHIRLHHIQPGKPAQNAYVERFNRSFRHEILNAHLFQSLEQAQELAWNWLETYNHERPHESCNNLPPFQYAQKLSQTTV